MKNLKLIAIILCISMLMMALVGCNVEGDSDDTTEAQTTQTEETTTDGGSEETTLEETDTEKTTDGETSEETTEEVTTEAIEYDYNSKFVSLVSYKNEATGAKQLTSNSSISGKFAFDSGYLEQINIFVGALGDIKFSLYKWAGDYNKSVAAEPVKTVVFMKDELTAFQTAGMFNMEMSFEDNEVEKGSYLFEITTVEGSNNHAVIYLGTPWNNKTIDDDYKKYGLVSYMNGVKDSTWVAQASYVYKEEVVKQDVVQQPIPTDKDAEGTAKVILIGGQSNAVGVSLNSELRKKIDADKYQEYLNGYSNVQIMYDNCSGNANSGFVNTKLGQAVDTKSFGPELGMAEYLATNFPNEKFYIIKYAMGGSVLETQWYDARTNTIGPLLSGFTSFVQKGLQTIEDAGLTPKIIGFVWNQGESDSIWLAPSYRYYANQEGLVNYVRTTFADYASAKGIGFMDAGIVGNIWNAYKNINLQKYAFSLTSPINFYIETTDYEIINTLEENNDIAHYDSLGMLKLGQLYGAEIAKMLG